MLLLVASLGVASVKTNIGEPSCGSGVNASSMPFSANSGQSPPPLALKFAIAETNSFLSAGPL